MFVCCECCVLSGRGLSDELITRPEESYRLWCVVVCDLETSRMRWLWPALGRSATEKKIKKISSMYDATTPSGPWSPSKGAFSLSIPILSPPTSYSSDFLIAISSSICKPWRCIFEVLWIYFFLRGEVDGHMPNPQPGGLAYPFSSGSSPLTCPAWETLPVAMLPPA